MKYHHPPAPQNAGRNSALSILATIALLLLPTVSTSGQSATDGKTPLALSPGAPAGSYALSGVDNINLFNGNLNLPLPLLNIGGRGEAGFTVSLPIEQKWRVERYVNTFNQEHNYPDPNWWGGLKPGYGPGAMQGRKGGDSVQQCGYEPYDSYFHNTLTRLTFTTGDGTEYELRDAATNGKPATTASPGLGCVITEYNRGKIFVTADGSAATFVSDEDIFDDAVVINGSNSGLFYPSGYLMLRDGVRYRVDLGKVTWMRDRNGNRVNFSYDSFARVTTITDSLNRQVTISYADLTTSFYDQVSFKGSNGASRILKIWYADLSTALRPGSGYSLQTYQQLFPQLNSSSSSIYNPKVISAVEMPDRRRYRLYYNPYGEPARVEFPTGAAFEYDYGAGIVGELLYNYLTGTLTESTSGVTGGTAIYRRVIEKRVYPDGSTLEGKTTFSRPESYNSATISYENLGYVVVDKRNAAGTLLARTKHYHHGGARFSLFTEATSYPSWKEGREYQTEIFDANGTTLKQRQIVSFAQRASVSWWTGGADSAPPNDPRTLEVTTTLVDTNQVAKQTFGYDDSVPFNNQNNIKEYNFGAGAPGALLRETRSTFITAANYTGTAVHLRSLQSEVSVRDGGGVERARTTFEYDNYNAATHHAALVTRSTVSGFDASFSASYTTRGNVTGVTSYLLTNGTVRGSVSSYAQYDILGNTVRSVDAKGFATDFAFADCFGMPNGNARLNSQPPELSSAALASYAFVTSVTNQLAHTAYTQFDYYTGRAVDAEDLNGVVSSGYSDNEPLDRPTKIIRAVNTAVQNQTVFSYDDAGRIITTASDLNSSGDGVLVSKLLYDGLGRTTETRQYEGGTNYIATQTQYDALGRPFKTSNPFRPWQSESAVWTTQAFDALGRVTSVTTPDNAVVSTAYSGNSITVTDQAGKKRKSVTDALGRLIEVYEDPAGLNYQTTYAYDVLDNLVKVTQGSQQRFFMYDSLKRLIRARNPEQSTNAALNLSDPLTGNSAWSIGYEYDNNGNLRFKTDARGVVTEHTYDALNRVTMTLYRINGQPDPNTGDVQYMYDNATYGKGRLWLTYKWGTSPSHTAVGQYDALGRVKQFYNSFGDGQGGWSVGYEVNRTYNRAGAVASQTYPSGRTVSYAYDSAGRTTSFTGNLGGVSRTYASAFVYNARSQVTQERFGTQTPLYHKLQYNIRGQLWDVRVSTGSDINGSFNRGGLQYFYDGSYGYGTSGPDNNGNVLFANTYILLDEQGNSWAIHRQDYDYDALNRLSSVKEYFVSNSQPESQQSLQSYSYDRWGNRTINTASWGTGINEKQFTVNTTNNRLGVPAGQSGVMTYDNAGNLSNDTYSGFGNRIYDGENKIVAAQDSYAGWSYYTYNADGQRVRRKVNDQETWQIYGIDGELIAEYAANGAVGSPQKEYGYRNGQLLITATNSQQQWLVPDHLGTPRIIIDQTGSLAGVKRHDYLPFGEELFAGSGGRTVAQGYAGDGVRQQFTQKERDVETGLDYFLARYYSSTQGRFTSVDPENAGADPSHPQSWNGYAYVWNRPTVATDPDGRKIKICDNEGQCSEISDADANKYTFNKDYQKANGFMVSGNKIFDHQGNQVGTWVRTSFDDLNAMANALLFWGPD